MKKTLLLCLLGALALGAGTVLTLPDNGGVLTINNLAAINNNFTYLANGTGLLPGSVTGTAILNNTVTSSDLATNTIQFVSVPLTLSQIQNMYTTPVVIVAAQGAGTLIEIQSCVLDLIYGSAAYTSGGAAQLSYGTALTYPASVTVAATFFTTFTASHPISFLGALAVSPSTGVLNTAVDLSNATQTFAGGTAGTGIIDCAYRVHGGLS